MNGRGLFEQLAESVDEAVFVTEPSGRMLYANKALERLTGYSAADFQFRQADNPFLHPDDAGRMGAFIAAFSQSALPVSEPVENRFFDRWGQSRWYSSVLARVEWEGQPAVQFVTRPIKGPSLDPGPDPVLRDYRALVESAGDGIVKLDARGRFLFANQRFCQLVGLDAVGLGHQALWELVAPADAPQAPRLLEPGRKDLRLVTASGATLWVEVNLTALVPTDELLAVVRDVTERRQFEQQLRQRQRLESLGLLSGGVAHDFNNVLMVVLTWTRVIEESLKKGEPATEYLEEIRKACDGAAAICKRMLAFSGQSPIEKTPLALPALVGEMSGLLRAGVPRSAGLTFAHSPGPDVDGDKGALQSMLMNLVTNAADALAGQAGTIAVVTGGEKCTAAQLARLELGEGLPGGRYATLEVADSGVGMDEQTRERMFEPFFSTRAAGHGLGLASVLGTVRGHQGAIRVRSAPGEGTTVTVFLPAAREVSEAPGRAAAAEVGHLGGTWLVVDDNPGLVQALTGLLVQAGCSVLKARDGVEACARLRTHPDAVSGAVVDVVMPAMSGPEVVAELRQIRPGLPVVLMSGYLENQALPEGVELLAKPFSPDALWATLRRAVASRTTQG